MSRFHSGVRKPYRMTPARHSVAIASMAAAFSLTPLHAADACRSIASATAKIWEIPVHLYLNQTFGARGLAARSSESIYVGGAIYVTVGGRWTRSRASIADLKSAQAEGKDSVAKPSCRYLRDEAVDGEAAAVYFEHHEGDGYKTDVTVWISKSRNVPLRSESDMDTGGADGKSRSAIRYDYKNVQPPPGVK